MPPRPLLVFDVNETLLDLEAAAAVFARILGAPGALRDWYGQLILYTEALSLAGDYVDLGVLGAAVLDMLAAARGATVSEADRQAMQRVFAGLPAHPDVAPALTRLRQAGFRLFTLTNNPPETAERQLAGAGVRDLFERVFSVDPVRRFKPAVETYRSVEQGLGVPPARLCLIACHAWDTLGAAAAGWDAALVLRPGNAPIAVGPPPRFIAADLHALADRLIAVYGG
jgi:2-haloacid dehalogenase